LRPCLSFFGRSGDNLASVVPLHWLFQESLNSTSRGRSASPAITLNQQQSGSLQPNCNQESTGRQCSRTRTGIRSLERSLLKPLFLL
jgi:hypothetical protein